MKALLAAVFALLVFVGVSAQAELTYFSKSLPQVNSDGNVLEIWGPQYNQPTRGWGPYKTYLKKLDGTYLPALTLDYPTSTVGTPEEQVFFYKDSLLVEGVGETFTLVDSRTGKVISKLPESPSGRHSAVIVPLDKAGTKFCEVSPSYAEVLNVQTQTWEFYKDFGYTKTNFPDSYHLHTLPVSSDGTFVTFVRMPENDEVAAKLPYEVYRMNCFNPEDIKKIGTIPEFLNFPGRNHEYGEGWSDSVVQVSKDTFIVATFSMLGGGPASFVKIQVTNSSVKTLAVVQEPKFYGVSLMAFNDSKNEVVLFGRWKAGLGLGASNAALDVSTMTVKPVAPLNVQNPRYAMVNRFSFALNGKDLVNVGSLPTTLDPSWTNPVTSPVFKTEVFNSAADTFDFLP